MQNQIVSVRMDPALVEALKSVAREESRRRGERVTWARLLRDAARQLLRDAERRLDL